MSKVVAVAQNLLSPGLSKSMMLSYTYHKSNFRRGNKVACTGKHLFNSSQSSTYQQNGQQWEIEYGSGSASGFLGVDTVSFGAAGTQQLVVPKTTFGQATDIADVFAQDPAIDGILGLAFTSLAVDNVIPPFVRNFDVR
jgi:hypothetical protein